MRKTLERHGKYPTLTKYPQVVVADRQPNVKLLLASDHSELPTPSQRSCLAASKAKPIQKPYKPQSLHRKRSNPLTERENVAPNALATCASLRMSADETR